jgi:hypothetical protein
LGYLNVCSVAYFVVLFNRVGANETMFKAVALEQHMVTTSQAG